MSAQDVLEFLLPVLPLLLLVVSLLLGHYPGCEAIVRLSERMAVRPDTRDADVPSRPKALRSHVASGGLLIAFGHAQRPPPLAL